MAVEGAASPPPKGRLLLGAGLFILGWVVTFATSSLISASSTLPTSLVPIVVFVGPKLGMLAAIGILGKPGFAYLKRLVFSGLKPAAEVSVSRHRVGIVMFVAALLLASLEPYAGIFFPDVARASVRYSLSVDLLLLVSIVVLGGDFWDKIRALFFRDAKAYFPWR